MTRKRHWFNILVTDFGGEVEELIFCRVCDNNFKYFLELGKLPE